MDTVLKQQPQDTWDSFPLFQIINDYLRTDGMIIPNLNITQRYRWVWHIHCLIVSQNTFLCLDKLRNGKFHQHLRDTFAPQVVRYVDLMESNIGQSISKGFEKERWEIKG